MFQYKNNANFVFAEATLKNSKNKMEIGKSQFTNNLGKQTSLKA